MSMRGVVYKIDFPDGHSYVGSTSHFTKRRQRHLAVARGDRHQTSKALSAKLREHPVCCIYAVASVLRANDMHLVERDVIASERPTLNSNAAPSPVHFHGTSLPANPRTRACRLFNVNPQVYGYRRARGYTVRQALGIEPAPPTTRSPKVEKRIIAAGGKRGTIDAWAAKLGVKPGVIHSRLYQGWTESQAVGVDPSPSEIRRAEVEARRAARAAAGRTRKVEVFVVRGTEGTLSQLAEHFNISVAGVQSRLSRGWTLEEALAIRRLPPGWTIEQARERPAYARFMGA